MQELETQLCNKIPTEMAQLVRKAEYVTQDVRQITGWGELAGDVAFVCFSSKEISEVQVGANLNQASAMCIY
jgi:hypothetical protein